MSYSAGTGFPARSRTSPRVTARDATLPTITASSGPRNLATSSWGRTKDVPAARVRRDTPLRALTPPPPAITMRKGIRIMKGSICTTVMKARGRESSPVTLARVTVGIPTDPKAVGKALASMQTRQAVTGSMPMTTSMLAGMAMAVPKPAMPSRKPPKHQPMSRMMTRLSRDTPASIRLITSMAPVRRDRL